MALDGRSARLGPAVNVLNGGAYAAVATAFEWSPDGSAIALLDDQQLWLLATDGGEPQALHGRGYQAVAWSPDGAQLAVGIGAEIRVMRRDGAIVATIDAPALFENPSAFAWSPDGRWIAWAEATAIIRSSPDCVREERRPLDGARVLGLGEPLFPAIPGLLGWSWSGDRVLLAAGGLDSPGAILAVPWDADAPPVVLVQPTFALRGIGASWQIVHD